MLDVTRLRVLAAVARHGSVTSAARELNYAQPSVSHHLARLEAETGSKLIQRSGRGIRLTDAGRLLAERAAEILGRLDAAENELAAHVGLRHERVRLAAFPSALAAIVPAAAARLRSENPGADLTLAEAEPPEALRLLRAGYVDMALVFMHEPDVTGHGARATMLVDEPVCLVTRAEQPDAPSPGSVPDLAAHARERWIAGCDRCRAYLLQQCARAGFTPKIAFTTDDYVAAQALVAAGLGLTILPALALRAARHPGITAAPLPGAHRYVYAMTYGEPPDPPASMRLLEALTAAGRRAMTTPPESADPGKN